MSGTWKTLGDLIILEIWNYRDMKFSKNSLVFFPIFWIEENKVDIIYKDYIYWIPWSVYRYNRSSERTASQTLCCICIHIKNVFTISRAYFYRQNYTSLYFLHSLSSLNQSFLTSRTVLSLTIMHNIPGMHCYSWPLLVISVFLPILELVI